MSLALERTMSVHQTSKAATALPLEIQQQVFAYLDSRSFYSAQKVCRYWRYACRASDPLKRQLRKMPVFMPPAEKAPLDPALMQNVFDEAARSLMLGVSTERAHDTPGSMSSASKAGFSLTPRVVATPDGNVVVTLNGRLISVYDVVGEQASLRTQRMINDLKETIGSGPWLKVNCNTSSELALSSDGSLLAIAQERTIQIYDLKDEPHSFTINEYVGSATGHYICGLDFEQNDHALRVRLSGKGTVVYLGTPMPPNAAGSDVPAGIEHWKGKSGLRHVFLDSSLLSVQDEKSDETSRTSRISGIQILHDFEQGYLFAGQHHGGGDSSFYMLGHVRTTDDTGAATAQPQTATILARLESFLSSWKFTLDASSEGGLGLWENMPSAHEHHPRFAVSSQGRFDFLALAERDKKRIRPAPLTQLFLYRLPSHTELRRKLVEPIKAAELCSVPVKTSGHPTSSTSSRSSKFVVPRMPLCLTTIQGDVVDLKFSAIDYETCTISASTVDTTRTWEIQDR